MAFAPILAAALVAPELVGPIWKLALAALLGIQAGVAVGLSLRLDPGFLLVIMLWVQFLFLIWVVRNIELMRVIGRVDRFFKRQEEKAARAYERRAWLRKFHFVGLAFFTFLPVGSGLLTGVFVGKITGMSDRRLVASIFLGTVVWAVPFAYGTDAIVEALRRAV